MVDVVEVVLVVVLLLQEEVVLAGLVVGLDGVLAALVGVVEQGENLLVESVEPVVEVVVVLLALRCWKQPWRSLKSSLPL